MYFVMEDIDDIIPKGQPTTKLSIYAENGKEQKLLEAFAEYFKREEPKGMDWI